jgi:hypothetical protein
MRLGVAFAETGAPVAAIAISAPATAIFVSVPLAIIHRSFGPHPNGQNYRCCQ